MKFGGLWDPMEQEAWQKQVYIRDMPLGVKYLSTSFLLLHHDWPPPDPQTAPCIVKMGCGPLNWN